MDRALTNGWMEGCVYVLLIYRYGLHWTLLMDMDATIMQKYKERCFKEHRSRIDYCIERHLSRALDQLARRGVSGYRSTLM